MQLRKKVTEFKVRAVSQCDQMLEKKVAQCGPKIAQKVDTTVFI